MGDVKMCALAKFMAGAFLGLALTAFSAQVLADAGAVKALLAQKYKSLPSGLSVKPLGVGGLYEVNLMGQEAYTNEKVEFLLVGGSLIDAKTLDDVTSKRKPQFLRDFFLNLPLDGALKTVYGKGERILVSFEDPDCPLCREQHADWAKNPDMFNTTVYAFMFPLNIHPDARRKAEFIWCQPEPASTWSAWMAKGAGLPLEKDGRLLATAPASCKAGIDRVAQSEGLARSLGYHQTPRFIFATGLGASGVLTLAQFNEAFSQVANGLSTLVAVEVKKEPSAGAGAKDRVEKKR
jgi:thiol:disulfide interchange protein DsbC